ncbi:MAG: DUF4160 domain-containing protein [Planctomycetes bacterium]|nr:DUF4160 domain-containing protein [Planctomycetota bacterium]
MPTISMFYGIIIYMFFFDDKKHHRPHIHANYGGAFPIFCKMWRYYAGDKPPALVRLRVRNVRGVEVPFR